LRAHARGPRPNGGPRCRARECPASPRSRTAPRARTRRAGKKSARSLEARHSSCVTHAVQPPAAVIRRTVAEQPKARPIRRLDAEVIARQPDLVSRFPPSAEEALRTVGAADTMTALAPHEEARRMIGYLGHRRDPLGGRENASRRPGLPRCCRAPGR